MTLRDKAIELNKTRFFTRQCSMCKYPLAYRVWDKEFNILIYDAGCDCVTYHATHESSWDDLENFYNMQSAEGKAELDRIWWGNDATENKRNG